MKRLLLLSNSTLPGESFLGFAIQEIQGFLNSENKHLVFVPFAAVTFSYDDYTQRVSQALAPLGYQVQGLHEESNPRQLIDRSGGILVGGGNSFHLLGELKRRKLIQPIIDAVERGIPYVGWSAGSNVACPTIMTTNDMPIVELDSLHALGLVRFQINPHFTEEIIPNHAGESRKTRIMEFLEANGKDKVIGLPEGTLLIRDRGRITFTGSIPALLFARGKEPARILPGTDVTNLVDI